MWFQGTSMAIRPEKWHEETGDAMMAEEASEWTGKELERFRDYDTRPSIGGIGGFKRRHRSNSKNVSPYQQ